MTVRSLQPFGKLIHASGPLIAMDELVPLLSENKLIIVRGLPPMDRDSFLNFCQNFPMSRTLNWDFGPVMEMRETPDPKNYLFSRERVPFHWDGAFYEAPDYLVFSCVDAPWSDAGGETLFTNTELIFRDASPDQQSLWSRTQLRYATKKVAHYGGTIENTLVQSHPHSKRPILRFAEPVNTYLNPVSLDVNGVPEDQAAEIIASLTEKIYASKYCYRHQWQAGDLLFADNHSLIHGRNAFAKDCPRHLRRVQLIRERH